MYKCSWGPLQNGQTELGDIWASEMGRPMDIWRVTLIRQSAWSVIPFVPQFFQCSRNVDKILIWMHGQPEYTLSFPKALSEMPNLTSCFFFTYHYTYIVPYFTSTPSFLSKWQLFSLLTSGGEEADEEGVQVPRRLGLVRHQDLLEHPLRLQGRRKLPQEDVEAGRQVRTLTSWKSFSHRLWRVIRLGVLLFTSQMPINYFSHLPDFKWIEPLRDVEISCLLSLKLFHLLFSSVLECHKYLIFSQYFISFQALFYLQFLSEEAIFLPEYVLEY